MFQKTLHISIVTASSGEATGGLAAYLRGLADGLSRAHCVSVAARFTSHSGSESMYSGEEAPRRLDHGNYKTRIVAPRPFWKLFLPRLRSLVSRPALQPLAKWLYGQAYQAPISEALPGHADIVHYIGTGWELLGFAALAEARKRGAAFTIWPAVHHGTWGDSPLDVSLYNQADAVFTQSDFERAHLIEQGVEPSRLHRCGLAPATETEGDGAGFRQRHGLGERPLILFVGRKDRGKGYHALREAILAVLAALPSACLIAIGPDCEPPYPPLPETAALDLGQASEQEKADALAACDVFCLPSSQEAFGIVYVEAWACAKPVVGGPAPAVCELIEEGVTGLHVTQKKEDIAAVLIRLLSDSELRRQMGANGLKRQQEAFTWEHVIETHQNIFALVIDEKSPEVQAPVRDHSRIGLAVFSLAAVCFGLCSLSLIHRPLLWLLGVVPDDAFYYLQTARHLAAGQGSTFDGIHTTNGYHPLWMALMTVCAKIFPDRVALLRACLTLAFAFQFGTSLLLTAILRRWTSLFWAWVGGAFWLLNPLSFLLSLQGVEASLYVFALSGVVFAYLRLLEPYFTEDNAKYLPTRNLALFGLSLSAAYLARTEAIIFVVVTLGFLAVTLRREMWPRTIGIPGGVFLIGILPWHLFSLLATGSLTQKSGLMKMLWAAQINASLSPLGRLHHLTTFLRWSWFGDPQILMSGLRHASHLTTLMQIVCLLFLPIVIGWAAKRGEARLLRRISLWLLASWLATGCFYGLMMTDIQLWYFAQPAFILYLVTWSWAAGLLSRPAVSPACGAGVCALGLLLCANFWRHTPSLSPWQQDVYRSQPQIEKIVPADARIGCFNAGIPAYFSPRIVVNLDGLVNNSVYPYWRAHDLSGYLAKDHIAYIADETDSLARAQKFSAPPIKLTPIASYPLRGWEHPTRWLWRVGPK